MRITRLTLSAMDAMGEIVLSLAVAGFVAFVTFVLVFLGLTLALEVLMVFERRKVMLETQETLLTEVSVEQRIARNNPRLYKSYTNVLPNSTLVAGIVFVLTFVAFLFFTNHVLSFGF